MGAGEEKRGESDEHERLANVMQGRPQMVVLESGHDQGLSLLDIWLDLWRGKWLIVGLTAGIAVVAIVYVLLATEWYRAEVVLAPAEERTVQGLPGGLGGLAGLAGIAGISVGGADGAEAFAVLRSRDFVRGFITENDLLHVVLFEEWDKENSRWKDTDPDEAPDIRDGVKFFNKKVYAVSRDTQSGLVTLTIDWIDAETAAIWANKLAARINRQMRARSLAEAERNVSYLRAELAATNLTTLKESIGALLESELQKLMLARGTEEFAFTVVDSAQPPKDRERPKRALFVILATLFGGFAGAFVVVVRAAYRRNAADTPVRAS